MKPLLKKRINKTIMAGLSLIDDQQASEGVNLFPRLQENNELIPVGTRINWNGMLKRANVDLWDTAENNPDNAPILWTNIEYKLGYRIAPETFTSTNAAALDEYMWFGEELYKSLMAGNVFTAEQAPNTWELIDIDSL